jgi:hypothetical protein
LIGDISGLRGDCTMLRGDCSGLIGDCSGLSGDLNSCEISEEDRNNGIYIYKLVELQK